MKRFIHAVKHEAFIHSKNAPLSMAAVAGALLLITMVTWIFEPQAPMLWNQFFPISFIVLVILTSGAFGDLKEEPNRIEYLLRPSTAAEKAGAKLLVTTVGYWLVFVAIWIVAAFTARFLYMILFSVPWAESAGAFEIETMGPPATYFGRETIDKLVPMSWVFKDIPMAWRLVRSFLAFLPVHAVFFFGSVYFRRKAFGRTLLSLVIWGLSYAVLGSVLVRIVFAPYFANPQLVGSVSENQILELVPRIFRNPALLKTVFDVFIATVFYGLSWRRLMETEA